ncbi:MAG: hypothetical protein ACP5LQ_05965 [Candidatus Methanodesulfokora sp.]
MRFLKCPFCGLVWLYRGRKDWTICPRCGERVNTSRDRADLKDVEKFVGEALGYKVRIIPDRESLTAEAESSAV